ncbi:MAG: hypothetical protein K0U36_05265 [Alphaproteobacteria bacterium]|nr:hypothetical protein [Alphaproteobacteria bacterium]
MKNQTTRSMRDVIAKLKHRLQECDTDNDFPREFHDDFKGWYRLVTDDEIEYEMPMTMTHVQEEIKGKFGARIFKGPGVYLIARKSTGFGKQDVDILDEDIVYVGQSINVFNRLGQYKTAILGDKNIAHSGANTFRWKHSKKDKFCTEDEDYLDALRSLVFAFYPIEFEEGTASDHIESYGELLSMHIEKHIISLLVMERDLPNLSCEKTEYDIAHNLDNRVA